MKRVLKVAILVVLVSCRAHSQHANDAAIAIPIDQVQGVSSWAGQIHLTLYAVSKFPYQPAFSYKRAIGTPTLYVRPGDTIFLTLHNQLPRVSFFDDAVNVHFHGLDVPPIAPADDVLSTLAQPGQTLN